MLNFLKKNWYLFAALIIFLAIHFFSSVNRYKVVSKCIAEGNSKTLCEAVTHGKWYF